MPVSMDPLWQEHGSNLHTEEYGCGFYGCVMPTRDPDVVLKITNDASEAQFALQAMALVREGDIVPEGIVEYFKVLQLAHVGAEREVGGEPNFRIYETERTPRESDERLYLLWRGEVSDPGFLFQAVNELREAQEVMDDDRSGQPIENYIDELTVAYIQLGNNLAQIKSFGTWMRGGFRDAPRDMRQVWGLWSRDAEYFVSSVYQGSEFSTSPFGFKQVEADFNPSPDVYTTFHDVSPLAVAACFRLACIQVILDVMEEVDQNVRVGQALSYYFQRGMLLADVHPGNVGLTKRDTPIIFDPGQMLRFDRTVPLKRFTTAGVW
jgi:hypothetical protein